MSIILKGIDLPDKKLMEMFESDNHICIGGNYYPLMIKDVIQIPKYHGKIVDLDDLVVKHWDGNFMIIDNEAYDNAVAILEAEEQ